MERQTSRGLDFLRGFIIGMPISIALWIAFALAIASVFSNSAHADDAIKFYGCMNKITGHVSRISADMPTCTKSQERVWWNQIGPIGPQGPSGNTLHLVDANGQDLGKIVGYNETEAWTYLSSLEVVANFYITNATFVPRTKDLLFEQENCVGVPYISARIAEIQSLYKATANVNKIYRVAQPAIVQNRLFLSKTNYTNANFPSECINFQTGIQLLDSYSETNTDESTPLLPGEGVGQTFRTPNDEAIYNLHSAVFYMKKTGNPSGTMMAYLFEHTGTYGVSGIPTGNVLAMSDAVSATRLTNDYTLVEFTFKTNYEMSSNTPYCVVVGLNTNSEGTILFGEDGTMYSALGNGLYHDSGAWHPWTHDLSFFVYGTSNPNTRSSVELEEISLPFTEPLAGPLRIQQAP